MSQTSPRCGFCVVVVIFVVVVVVAVVIVVALVVVDVITLVVVVVCLNYPCLCSVRSSKGCCAPIGTSTTQSSL